MFNILRHKGNANQDYTNIPSHHSQIANHQKNKQMLVSIGKKKPLSTVGGNVSLCNHYGNQYGSSTKN
jgi:hypothetical protein